MLAHVDVPFASSCFSPAYGAWAAQTLGPIDARPLGEDVRVLGELARTSPDAFASVQALAWAFHSAEAASAAADFELRDARVDHEDARAIAIHAGPIAEVLRAAAELELPLLGALRLPASHVPPPGAITAAAPALARCAIAHVPALGLRGRVLDRRVFVGVPGLAGATAEHVAWQAAHEATVEEVSTSDAGRRLPFLELERRALGLMQSRARRAGLAAEHARWLAHLDLRELGPIADVEDAL